MRAHTHIIMYTHKNTDTQYTHTQMWSDRVMFGMQSVRKHLAIHNPRLDDHLTERERASHKSPGQRQATPTLRQMDSYTPIFTHTHTHTHTHKHSHTHTLPPPNRRTHTHDTHHAADRMCTCHPPPPPPPPPHPQKIPPPIPPPPHTHTHTHN